MEFVVEPSRRERAQIANRTLRSDARSERGFVAAWATAPSTHNTNTPQGLARFDNDRVLHRNLAISSIGVGTAGYLIMLFKGK